MLSVCVCGGSSAGLDQQEEMLGREGAAVSGWKVMGRGNVTS